MAENKIKKSKHNKKILLSNGFREPFQILLDYTFVKGISRLSMGINNIRTLLKGDCVLSIPKCEYDKYKKDLKPKDITGECEIIKCKETESHINCLINIIRNDNRHHYLLGTSDTHIKQRIEGISNLPLIKIKKGALVIVFGNMKRIQKLNTGESVNKKELKVLRKIFKEDSI